MDLNLLKTFCAVAGLLNISRAAEQVNLTQPAVSLQIKQLETIIGAPLFLRHPLRLTDVGDHLRVNALQILKQWEHTLEFVQSEQNLVAGKLTIACSDAVMRFCLLRQIEQFRKLYPYVELSIINRTSTSAFQAVNEGSADIAIAMYTGAQTKLIHRLLFDYQEVVAVPSEHKLAFTSPVNVSQLSSETLLLLEEKTVSRRLTDQWFAAQHAHPLKVMALGSVDAQIEMSRIGLGVALIPDFAVPDDLYALPIKGMATRQMATYYQRLKPSAQAWLRLTSSTGEFLNAK